MALNPAKRRGCDVSSLLLPVFFSRVVTLSAATAWRVGKNVAETTVTCDEFQLFSFDTDNVSPVNSETVVRAMRLRLSA